MNDIYTNKELYLQSILVWKETRMKVLGSQIWNRATLVAHTDSPCNAGDLSLIPGLGWSPWRREWLPTPTFLPGEFHGQRGLIGYTPWGCRVRCDWVTDTFNTLTWKYSTNWSKWRLVFKTKQIWNQLEEIGVSFTANTFCFKGLLHFVERGAFVVNWRTGVTVSHYCVFSAVDTSKLALSFFHFCRSELCFLPNK